MIGMVDMLVRSIARERVDGAGTGLTALPAGVELRRSRLIPALGGLLSGMAGPAAAVALGRTILVHPDVGPDARLIRHELAHVRQWQRQPFTFPIRYIRAHIRHGYWRNPFEEEARAAEAGPVTPGEEA